VLLGTVVGVSIHIWMGRSRGLFMEGKSSFVDFPSGVCVCVVYTHRYSIVDN
jgi:hypothetical protein